jgi:hypothetical protein
VTVSWKMMWKIAYGANVSTSNVNARSDRLSSTNGPAAASASMMPARTGESHGRTKVWRKTATATRTVRFVHSITTPEKSSPAWLPSALR